MQTVHTVGKAWYILPLVIWVSLAAGCATTSLKREPTSHSTVSPAPPVVSPSPSVTPAETGTTAKPQPPPPQPPQPRPAVAPRKPPSHPRAEAPKTTPPEKRPTVQAKSTKTKPPIPKPPAERSAAVASNLDMHVAALMGRMTTEEKVGQLFILQLRDEETGKLFREASPAALRIITTYHPGGVILFGGNMDTIDQTRELVEEIQKASKIPLFVAVDEEGGEVSRLTASGRMHAVHMPAAAVVGAAGDPRLAYREGRYVGQELRSLGINMDLAPVADVDTNPANTVIGTRAFSSDPQVAARMTSSMVRGLQSVDVSSVIKHFPGHGDTTTDSHVGAAVVHQSLDRLKHVELVPFRAGIAAGADGVMVGHLLLPDILEQKNIPASFSPYVLGQLLRKELKFKKLIITDALNMGAIVNYWNARTAAIDAFQAGADMLLMPAGTLSAYQAILDAVKSDEISQQRLNESVRRILTVKFERRIFGPPLKTPDPHKVLGSSEGKRLLAEIDTEAAGKTAKALPTSSREPKALPIQ